MPMISVVVPTHNRPDMLAETLASIRAQTFTDIETIVVSNGESEEMRRASREAAAGCAWFALDEGNVSAARNFGAARGQGEWIAFLDDDDLWLPRKLERQLAAAQETGAAVVACDCVQFYLDGTEKIDRIRLPDGWSYTKALGHYRWWTLPSATLISRRAFHNVGGFDPHLSYIEDMDLWHRISWNHTIHQMDEVLCRYRQGHVNTFHPQNARKRARRELQHFDKMRQVTPRHLRHTLQPFILFALPRFVALGPPSLVMLLRRLRPRAQWIKLKKWLYFRSPTAAASTNTSSA